MQIEANETGLPGEAGIAVPDDMLPALRSDHAGETGAVAIYRGVLAVARDRNLRAFAQRHLATEAGHLEIMEALVRRAQRSRLLPVWRMAGCPRCSGPPRCTGRSTRWNHSSTGTMPSRLIDCARIPKRSSCGKSCKVAAMTSSSIGTRLEAGSKRPVCPADSGPVWSEQDRQRACTSRADSRRGRKREAGRRGASG